MRKLAPLVFGVAFLAASCVTAVVVVWFFATTVFDLEFPGAWLPSESAGSLKRVELRLEAGERGVLEHASGVRLQIPRRALPERARVSIAEVEPPPTALPAGVSLGPVFEVSVGGASLERPVTLTIPYDAENVSASDVRAVHWDDGRSGWELLEGEVDEDEGIIEVEVSDLSPFSTLVRDTGSEDGADVEIVSCGAEPPEPVAGTAFVLTATVSGVAASASRRMFVEFEFEGRDAETLVSPSVSADADGEAFFRAGAGPHPSGGYAVRCVLRAGVPAEETNLLPALGEDADWISESLPEPLDRADGPVVRIASEPEPTAQVARVVPAPAPTAPAVSVDAETLDCGLASEAECELAGMYAPVLVTHPDERYLPRDVEGFVYRSDLVDGGLGPDAPGIEISDPDDLGDAAYGEEHYLDLDGRGDRGGFPPDWPERVPTVYAAVRHGAGGALYLQYHIFYYYDHLNPAQSEVCGRFLDVPSFCDPHEADWELIQLEFRADSAATVLDQGLEPEAVAYSQHGWSEDRAWGSPDLEVAGDSHPVAYAALGKHANYFGTYAGAEAGAQALDLCEAARGLPLRPLDATLLGAGSEGGFEAIFEGTGWAPFVCERLQASEGQVSIVLDQISLDGKRLLPPTLSADAGVCHAEDPSPCGYELSFIDDDTPWAAYRGRWGGSGKEIRGPGHGASWTRPGEWARYRTDVVLEAEPAVAPTSGFLSVSAGQHHICGVKADGFAVCWGNDSSGQSSPPLSSFASVSVGVYHTCGLRSDGTAECWGSDVYGQSSPPAGAFASISAGFDHTCGLRSDGTAECWGSDGGGRSSPPDGAFASISAGGWHTCGSRSDGAAECWGDDGQGRSSPPDGAFASISAGGWHTCGLRSDGTAECWGEDEDGQSSPPAGAFASVSAGGFHTCGLRSDGAAECWGDDGGGRSSPPGGAFASVSAGWNRTCGVGTDGHVGCWGFGFAGQSTPPVGRFLSISAGDYHNCGLRETGTVKCWGSDGHGQSSPPNGVFNSVSAGSNHTCGVKTDGSVACWGDNGEGQSTTPEGKFTYVSAGWGHSCGLRDDGEVACWGDNFYDQSTPPAGPFMSISAGQDDTCGVKPDGSIECWGLDDDPPVGAYASVSSGREHACGVRIHGYIECWGDDRRRRASPPSGVFTSVSTGVDHACGIRKDGPVECWGENYHDQSAPPNETFISVASGALHTCGIRTDGTIGCWGFDRLTVPTPDLGPTADNDGFDLSTDTNAASNAGLLSVSADGGHACVIGKDGIVECWGSDSFGQSSPPNGTFNSVSAGADHTCGVRNDNLVDCWGLNESGQSTPPIGEFDSVSAGWQHTCGLRTDSSVECWGNNEYGQSSPPAGAFTSVSVGGYHSCALGTDGYVSCWGDDDDSQASPPNTMFISVDAGDDHNCGVRIDGVVECWGYSYWGQTTPIGGAFATVSAGNIHTCGVRIDGWVRCWGDNEHRQSAALGGVFMTVSAGDDSTCGLRIDGTVDCWGKELWGLSSSPSSARKEIAGKPRLGVFVHQRRIRPCVRREKGRIRRLLGVRRRINRHISFATGRKVHFRKQWIESHMRFDSRRCHQVLGFKRSRRSILVSGWRVHLRHF